MAKTKKVVEATEQTANPEMTGRRLELTRKLYELANDPAKADEFEKVRLELEAL